MLFCRWARMTYGVRKYLNFSGKKSRSWQHMILASFVFVRFFILLVHLLRARRAWQLHEVYASVATYQWGSTSMAIERCPPMRSIHHANRTTRYLLALESYRFMPWEIFDFFFLQAGEVVRAHIFQSYINANLLVQHTPSSRKGAS